jgi:hypothetical protein
MPVPLFPEETLVEHQDYQRGLLAILSNGAVPPGAQGALP